MVGGELEFLLFVLPRVPPEIGIDRLQENFFHRARGFEKSEELMQENSSVSRAADKWVSETKALSGNGFAQGQSV